MTLAEHSTNIYLHNPDKEKYIMKEENVIALITAATTIAVAIIKLIENKSRGDAGVDAR